MTTTANNHMTLTSPPSNGEALVGCRLAVCWSCTRRSRCADAGAALERVRFVLSVHPLDRHHAMLEAWLEIDDVRVSTVLSPISRPMIVIEDNRFTHIDCEDTDGSCLLAITLANDQHRVIYARTSLLALGLEGGTYDPPMLQRGQDERIAQSA